jgi:hypothetical protein
MSERSLEALPLAGAEAVQRDREVMHTHLRHRDFPFCPFMVDQGRPAERGRVIVPDPPTGRSSTRQTS